MEVLNPSWRDRLRATMKAKKVSARSLSLAAGRAPGYVHGILGEGKDPSVDNALAICSELGISLTYLVYGFDVSPETEEILALLADHPEARAGILQILRGMS